MAKALMTRVQPALDVSLGLVCDQNWKVSPYGFPLRFTINKQNWVGCDLRPGESVISLNQHLQPRHIGAIPCTALTYTALVDVSDLQVCRESLQP